MPGEYLVADPKGRTLTIGAIERQKFAYKVSRDNQTLSISSPLEAHRNNTLTLAMVAVDNGLENPQFACLEIEYGEADDAQAAVVTGKAQKVVALYEVDLGLHHVVRKSVEPVPESAHALIAIQGGADQGGPGGVIVACKD